MSVGVRYVYVSQVLRRRSATGRVCWPKARRATAAPAVASKNGRPPCRDFCGCSVRAPAGCALLHRRNGDFPVDCAASDTTHTGMNLQLDSEIDPGDRKDLEAWAEAFDVFVSHIEHALRVVGPNALAVKNYLHANGHIGARSSSSMHDGA